MDLIVLLQTGGSAFWLPAVLVAVSAYFFGCFNGAVIVSKYILHDDVRKHGSGNAGLTNFFRTFGGLSTLLVILADALKGILAVLLSVLVTKNFIMDDAMVITLMKYWTTLFCILGHMYPCMFHFKGGKGILSGAFIIMLLDWRIALALWVCFFVFAVLTRYVSLGSCCAAVSFPITTWFVYHNGVILALALMVAAIILYQHRGNIQRLLSGTENKFSLHSKK